MTAFCRGVWLSFLAVLGVAVFITEATGAKGHGFDAVPNDFQDLEALYQEGFNSVRKRMITQQPKPAPSRPRRRSARTSPPRRRTATRPKARAATRGRPTRKRLSAKPNPSPTRHKGPPLPPPPLPIPRRVSTPTRARPPNRKAPSRSVVVVEIPKKKVGSSQNINSPPTKTAPKSNSNSKPNSKPNSNLKPKPNSNLKPNSKSNPKPNSKSNPKPNSKSNPKPKSKSTPKLRHRVILFSRTKKPVVVRTEPPAGAPRTVYVPPRDAQGNIIPHWKLKGEQRQKWLMQVELQDLDSRQERAVKRGKAQFDREWNPTPPVPRPPNRLPLFSNEKMTLVGVRMDHEQPPRPPTHKPQKTAKPTPVQARRT